MSDGTLRAFGILLAVFQAAAARSGRLPPKLIGLEEPERMRHPSHHLITVHFAKSLR
jgi:predicted ATPase